MLVDEFLDIGTARPEETEAILRIMCDAFEMQIDAARPIFYSDPYFELSNKYVLRLDGSVVLGTIYSRFEVVHRTT